ncbi:MAG: hypothetical protein UR26_C0005G0032 [candidate division TM6 bacterium GW2011_GWF2_32_72]|nr:MAG: hypothetical protein UR26_C0005G0032 [candidate division TM6 bacterium GW2011_GWF2_32_72]
MLEDKVAGLIAIVKDLRLENIKLTEENVLLMEEINTLTEKLGKLEDSLLKGSADVRELSEEKVLAKRAMDELIRSIDSFVGSEE